MRTVRLHDKEFEPFIPEAELGGAIDAVAAEMKRKYDGKRPLFIGVLNGAFFFAAELVKRLEIECEITFVKVASYHGTKSSGTVSDLIGLVQLRKGTIRVRESVTQIISSACSIGSGGSIGREGANLQIAATFAAVFERWEIEEVPREGE